MTSPASETDILPLIDSHVVIVVDDDRATLSAVQRALQKGPWLLLTTDRPVQALDWLGEQDVSLLISDQRMPDMTGVEVLREARHRSPDTTRVFLTAYPEHVPLPEEVARWVISKPWDPVSLRKIVRQLLRERELMRRRRDEPPLMGDWDIGGGD